MVHLWLRSEVKTFEHRTALTPDICKQLIDAGFQISVERSQVDETKRCYDDSAFEAVGCKLVEEGSWPSAPQDAFIVGLKELPEDGSDLKHQHIFFAHCYKYQGGWKELMQRFTNGNGTILDLEFLTNDAGRRVAAFGYMAGFAGAFVGLDLWCQQQLSPDTELASIKPYPSEENMFEYLRPRLAQAIEKAGRAPKAMVMGALGRCGSGAVDLLTKAGIQDLLKWDMAETKDGGPFKQILDVDIFVNCIYLSKKIPPFVTLDMLNEGANNLSVLIDVSADTTNPNNPIPFATMTTTFDKPSSRLTLTQGVLDICTIDHLPTLLPKESSDRFSADLLPSLMELPNLNTAPVWQRALKLFKEKQEESQKSE